MFVRTLNSLVKFCKQEDGPTAVEYAVMLSLIVVACFATIGALGGNANATFGSVFASVSSSGSGSSDSGSSGGGSPDSFGFVTGGTYNLFKDASTGEIYAYPTGASNVPSSYEPGWGGLTYNGGGQFTMNGTQVNGSGWAAGQ